MSNAITIKGSTYTVVGTVKDKNHDKGVQDLHVLVYDKDAIGHDDFLGIGVTDNTGKFTVSFDTSKFRFLSVFDKSPDLYFIVNDGGLELLNTKNNVIENANESTPAINLEVSLLNDQLRALINETPVEGWVGGFSESNPEFAYPNPNLESLDMQDNLDNIPKLQRQQKVVWPEFSWESEPGEKDPKRCYQMFAPDISRLGYTNEGKVYSIICPQQGFTSPNLGSMNVEVTVTGNRGWANESNKELAADMSVVGKIWFSPSANENKFVKEFFEHFNSEGLPFPSNKANAIIVETFAPGKPGQIEFPLTNGSSKDFPIPNFAKHEGVSWTLGHLGVEIGPIRKRGIEKVDKFNQFIMDIFNVASGNMLKEGNILTWNVWFTAPELVDQQEWEDHAEKWRESINADHGSPEGPGTVARHYDGTPFSPLKELIEDELPKILAYKAKHLVG
ncbi:MAG: hypothetical protein GY810_04985 [Aureispira sp.]|nr:hypothetical protein [Aureispira sp.]